MEIDKLGVIVTGKTPNTKDRANFDGVYPFIKPGDLDIPGYIYHSVDSLSKIGFNKVPQLPKNSIMVTCIGNLGKIGITTQTSATNQQINSIIPSKFICEKYIFWFLNSMKWWLEKEASATTVAIINKGKFSNLPVSLPSIAEQKEISCQLDRLLGQVESLKNRIDGVSGILKKFRQSVLAAAVSGKLTEKWRSENITTDMDAFLNNIQTERLKLKKEKKLKNSFGKDVRINPLLESTPSEWRWVTFDNIAENKNNALKAGPFGSSLKKSDCITSGYKVYGQEQVIAENEKLTTYYINNEKFQNLLSCRVNTGDILISLVGTIGKVLILSDTAEDGIINPRLVKLSLNYQISRKYIKFYLMSHIVHTFYKGFSHGGTMDILNLGILRKLPINLPPLEEQLEIVKKVESFFCLADSIEKKIDEARSRVDNMTQSILAKAFSGELTKEWRKLNRELITGENSAETLLEKIKEEREKLLKQKAKVKKRSQEKMVAGKV